MENETFPDLSPRETQLLLHAAEGMTDNGISQRLGISVATVNSYWVRIRSKLGAQSRTEAVAMALRAQAETNLRKLQSENERLAQELAAGAKPEHNGEMDPAALQGFLQAAADGIMIVGKSGTILGCNPAMAEMFGYAAEELVGQPVSTLIPERFRERHILFIQEYFHAPTRRRMGHQLFTPGRRKDGSEFAVGVTLGTHDTVGGKFTVCMVRDATPELETLKKYAPNVPETSLFAPEA
jgi:PAS domain S-box-containing protein